MNERVRRRGGAEEEAFGPCPGTGASRLVANTPGLNPRDCPAERGGLADEHGDCHLFLKVAGDQAALVWTSLLSRRRRTADAGIAGAGRPGSSMARRRSNCASR